MSSESTYYNPPTLTISLILKIKSYYDNAGSNIAEVSRRTGLPYANIKKALRKGHYQGLFVYDRYYKKHQKVKRKIKPFFPEIHPGEAGIGKRKLIIDLESYDASDE